MPIFTFRCSGCGHSEEIICKPDERATRTETCVDAECSKFGDVLVWQGVEGYQAVNNHGVYKMAGIDSQGRKHVTPKAETRHGKIRRRP